MEEAEQLILSNPAPLPLLREALVASLIPRVGFTSYPWLPRGLPLGASRFGGPADLPRGAEWPRAEGRPLLLLAQLNFGELPIRREHPLVQRLPRDGWLCLFADIDRNASGLAGAGGGVVALQFDGDADRLVRHDPEPAADAEVWTQCHAVTVHRADHHLCLPDADAVDSPLPLGGREPDKEAYEDLRFAINDLARTRHEVKLLGTPTLFNPDLRRYLPDPGEWMLLLEFDGECSWLAGARVLSEDSLRRPSFADADFVQYFVRREDFEMGRLDRGVLDYMRT